MQRRQFLQTLAATPLFAVAPGVALATETPKALPTGNQYLDQLIGGLHPGELWCHASTLGGGRFAFTMNWIRNVLLNDHASVLYHTLEMGRDVVKRRLLELQDIEPNAPHYGENGRNLYLSSTRSIDRLNEYVKELQEKAHFGNGLVIISDLMWLKPESQEPAWMQMGSVIAGAQRIARDNNVAVVTLVTTPLPMRRQADARTYADIEALKRADVCTTSQPLEGFRTRSVFTGLKNRNSDRVFRVTMAVHKNGKMVSTGYRARQGGLTLTPRGQQEA